VTNLTLMGWGVTINHIDREFRDVLSKIRDDEQYWPYFKNCIVATHVPVKISPSKQIPYIGRKWTPTQNVMVVCDFRICFTFVWLDGKVLHMIYVFFWKLFEIKNCNFQTHLVCI
jgi:hypothetical protein